MFEGQANSSQISNRQKISQLHERIKMLDSLKGVSQLQSQDVSFASHTPLNAQKQSGSNLKSINSPSNKSYLNNNVNGMKNQTFNFNSPLSPSSLHNNQNSSLIFNQKLANSKLHNPQSDLYPLEVKYATIQQKFVKFKIEEQNLVHNIQREISQVNDKVKAYKRDSQKMHTKNQQVSDQLERQLNVQISQMNQEVKQLKKHIVNSIDTKYKAIKTQIMANIYQQFQVSCQTISKELQQGIQKVHAKIEQDQNIRDQVAQILINTFGDQIIKLQQSLTLERENRINKNSQILQMISKLQEKLCSQIRKQRKDTAEHIEQLQNTLQEVCYQIEAKILGR